MAIIYFDATEYEERGVSMPGLSCQQWADEFDRLGGQSCTVYPAWRIRGCQPGKVQVHVTGSEAAAAFVTASCEVAR